MRQELTKICRNEVWVSILVNFVSLLQEKIFPSKTLLVLLENCKIKNPYKTFPNPNKTFLATFCQLFFRKLHLSLPNSKGILHYHPSGRMRLHVFFLLSRSIVTKEQRLLQLCHHVILNLVPSVSQKEFWGDRGEVILQKCLQTTFIENTLIMSRSLKKVKMDNMTQKYIREREREHFLPGCLLE